MHREPSVGLEGSYGASLVCVAKRRKDSLLVAVSPDEVTRKRAEAGTDMNDGPTSNRFSD